MRNVIGFTLVAMSAVFLHVAGCATSETDPTSVTGTTSSTGTGGEGGAACVPEAEICDTLDNDCNGEVDEGCECLAGDTQDCYSGPDGTQGVGTCAMGTQDCNPTTNTFGPCKNDVTPAAADACDGLDNDCNGAVDEGIADLVCGVGACLAVAPGCVDGEEGQCVPGLPSLEICDGIDNNCNQIADETFPGGGVACDTGIPGLCSAGTMQCDGVGPVCMPMLQPAGELCDGLDNDCSGTVDDNIPGTGGACGTGIPGVCAPGSISCQDGTIDCFPVIAASNELCDGLDNDCNGQTDEGNPEGGAFCDTGQLGACQAGTVTCNAAALGCVANAVGSAELCDGFDNNCDGQTDEGNPEGGGLCGCGGVNACSGGQVVCQGGPITYFSEDFADNDAGWTFDPTWAIGATFAGGTPPDPAMDHTLTADNGVGGVVLGGNAPTTVHGFYYMTSPPFDTNVAGPVVIEFWRWLNSDYTPYMQNVIEVFNGTIWVQIFTTGGSPGVADSSWTKFTYDLAPYKNAAMQIRFGYSTGSGVFSRSSWNIDDILVAEAGCP